MKGKPTKARSPSRSTLLEMPEVKDWSKAQRNPYARGTRARLLDADLEAAFPDSKTVNDALRALLAMQHVLLRKKAG